MWQSADSLESGPDPAVQFRRVQEQAKAVVFEDDGPRCSKDVYEHYGGRRESRRTARTALNLAPRRPWQLLSRKQCSDKKMSIAQ